MTITGITEVSGKRHGIFIDGEFAFVLYRGELRLFGIKEDAEISGETYQEIMYKVLPKRAKLRSMNLLKSREYTEKQLRDKLQQGQYPQSVIDEAIAYVASFRYIDDERYALRYIECYIQSRSKRRIEMDLLRKGIGKELIAKAFMQLSELGVEADELSMAHEILQKRHFDPELADMKERQRMYGLLMRKGFNGDVIRKAMKLHL